MTSKAVNRMRHAEEKKTARLLAAKRRDSFPEQQRLAWSDTACQQTVDWLQHLAGPMVSSVMIYIPFRSELDTTLLIEWCWRKGISVIVPRCVKENRAMELYLLQAWDELVPGAYGIREPDSTTVQRWDLAVQLPDVIFVPGLSFDTSGGRLGYGGGYYDRFHEVLSRISAEQKRKFPLWVGLGYEAQWVDSVPMDEHDAAVDAVITEHGVTRGRAGWI
ncbi:5-formyltetrahydrofolate cyclo-ligase [Paenibacillus sp. OV219]|uniref:5-formyltetrahydrofolate cyclo-ligase n=1 Tax=Paenibacillus sp. OV219 TaxID=1884377 RepID=UPI0008CCC8E5|nr:5-formyltetrahydrofolate cyclo-ligase [Paenibacillus sp. OV219]SEO62411.1 5-formyltetrahydrofolate cyclo-ligase [Paenibacillus sp. OV219]